MYHVHEDFSSDRAQHVQAEVNCFQISYYPCYFLLLVLSTYLSNLFDCVISEMISDEGLGQSVRVESSSSNTSVPSFRKYTDTVLFAFAFFKRAMQDTYFNRLTKD